MEKYYKSELWKMNKKDLIKCSINEIPLTRRDFVSGPAYDYYIKFLKNFSGLGKNKKWSKSDLENILLGKEEQLKCDLLFNTKFPVNLLPSVKLNKTFLHKLKDLRFDNLDNNTILTLFRDGRVFSHFAEPWISDNYPLVWVKGCKNWDFYDEKYSPGLVSTEEVIAYDQKTFTLGGCGYRPSNQKGVGRVKNEEEFIKRSKRLIFCITSNIHLPLVYVRFVKGIDLLRDYPSGEIPFAQHDKFFEL